jgi:nitrogenase subunit NifH
MPSVAAAPKIEACSVLQGASKTLVLLTTRSFASLYAASKIFKGVATGSFYQVCPVTMGPSHLNTASPQ